MLQIFPTLAIYNLFDRHISQKEENNNMKEEASKQPFVHNMNNKFPFCHIALYCVMLFCHGWTLTNHTGFRIEFISLCFRLSDHTSHFTVRIRFKNCGRRNKLMLCAMGTTTIFWLHNTIHFCVVPWGRIEFKFQVNYTYTGRWKMTIKDKLYF